jgi:hypothetical protein
MNSDSIWQPNTGPQWLQALALPAQPWVKTFLELMKFSPALAADPQIFEAIHTKAVEKRAALWNANKELGHLPELDTAITREFVTEALAQIEVKVDSSAAEAFKHWAYRNFIHSELTGALLAWRVVLRHACGQGNPRYTLLPPPQSLLPLIPKISDWVSYERDQELHNDLRRLSPPYKDEDGLGLDISPEAMTVEEIVHNESTRDALRYIVDVLSESECGEVVAWAKAQGTQQQIPANLLLDTMLLE